MLREQRFDGQSGFYFNYVAGSRPDLGYVLINRFDGDLGFAVSELWDLNSQEKVHVWSFALVDELWKKSTLRTGIVDLPVQMAANRFRNIHALLDKSGDIYVGSGPMIKAGLCSALTLFQDDSIYHHSLERGVDGGFWVPSHLEPKTVDIGHQGFMDDGVVLVDPDGRVQFKKSVIQLLDENGLGYLIYGKGDANNDPIHLNDIQPVLRDGKYWKKGDLFLSLRHQSMIILYRPSSNQVVWFKQGPWMHQHDVDILSDHEIAVYNNNAALRGVSDWVVRGENEELIYDFDTDSVRSPWRSVFKSMDIRTATEGRGEVLNDEVFVEETNSGRLAQFSLSGSESWRYVNRAKDGKVYLLNWSRLVLRSVGDDVRRIVSGRKCS